MVPSNVWDLLVPDNAQVCPEEDDERSPLVYIEPVLKGLYGDDSGYKRDLSSVMYHRDRQPQSPPLDSRSNN